MTKRAIVVGMTRGRVTSRSSMQVSARKLAATLWKTNEMPLSDIMEHKKLLKSSENLRLVLSASVPHSDHTSCGSVSQRMDWSISGSHQRTPSLVSQKHKHLEPNVREVDHHCNASLAETEISYCAQTPRESTVGVRTRLKDVNNALVTCKELLKIVNRILAHNDQSTSSTSIVSALDSELERACLQVNQIINEQLLSNQREISYLVKSFAEERASYNNKQQEAVEAAIESIAGELEVEKKLRRQYKILNNKLGRELTETKKAFSNTVKELESEKKAREKMEQVCHDLASDIGENRAEGVELMMKSAKTHEDFIRKPEILRLSGKLRGKKGHTNLSECKDQFKEKNGVVDKLRNQLEALLKPKKSDETSCDKIRTYSSRFHFRSIKDEEKDGEASESSAESDFRSTELKIDNKKSFKWTHASTAAMDSKRVSTDDEMKARNHISEIFPSNNSYLQGSVSDGLQCGICTQAIPSPLNLLARERFFGLDKQSQKNGYKDELLRHNQGGT